MNLLMQSPAAQLVAKLTLLLLTTWLAHGLLASRNPRWRVRLWRVATVGIAALLITAALPPLVKLPVLTAANEVSTSPAVPTPVAAPFSGGSFFDGSSQPAVVTEGSVAHPLQPESPTPQPQPANQITTDGFAPAAQAPPTAIIPEVNWWAVGRVTYGIVLVLLLLRTMAGILLAHRASRLSVPAPQWIQDIATQLTMESGARPLQVRVTRRFASPILIGLRPVVLVPESLLESISAEQCLRGALAHEAAHAAGHDLFWDRALAIVLAFIWPHPLAWRGRLAHRAACERVCDRAAIDYLGDLATYRGLLARIALQVSGAWPSVGLAMARKAEVRERLAALVHCPAIPTLGRRAAALSIGVMLTVAVIGVGALTVPPNTLTSAQAASPSDVSNSAAPIANATPPTPVPATNPPVPPETEGQKPKRFRPEALQITVVRSDDGTPVPNAEIELHMNGERRIDTRGLKTNTEGRATFRYYDGEKPVYLWAIVRRPGLVPYYFNFGRDIIPANLPTEKSIRMDPGKKIGGRVVDAAGNPVEGARVSISVPATDTPTDLHYRLLDETTGKEGAWLLDGAPLSTSGLYIRVEHPRFIRSSFPVQDGTDGQYPLQSGLQLTGRVTTADGQPIPGAHITIGRDRWGSVDKPTLVNADGAYTVEALVSEFTWVTAEAPGYSPQVQSIEIGLDANKLDFRLLPGQITRFRFVDQADNSAPGVRIVADTWKGFRNLWWQAESDAQGIATWNGAPAEAVKFDVVGGGYSAVRNVVATPRDEPYVIRLHRPLKIEGTVTDASHKEVAEFQVHIGRKWPDRDGIIWDRNESSIGRQGRFAVQYDENCDAVYLRIEAPGFRPWTSEPIPFASGEQTVSAQLEVGQGPSGTVWTPDGQPAEGVQLTLVTKNQGMQFTSGYRPHGGRQTIASDKQGHFSFLPLDEPGLIVAVHDSGYSETTVASVAKEGGVHLHAWAKVELTVRRGSEPYAGATVAVNPTQDFSDQDRIRVFSYAITGVTGADGRVVLDRIVPREAFITKTIEQRMGSGSTIYPERSTRVPLAPGGTAQAELGGSGSMITGRFSVAGVPPLPHQWSLNTALSINTAQRADPAAEQTSKQRYFNCLVGKDGAFRIDDIPPGKYNLTLRLTAVPDPNSCGAGDNIGLIQRVIEVPDGGQPLDLGVIEGAWLHRLGPGDKAPDFVAEGITGPEVRMEQLQGRLLLLDFWATWCGPCLVEMPRLVELHKEFATDDRFRMVGLSIDNSLLIAKELVEKNDWPWACAYVGPGTHALIPTRYDVESIPEKFLIDTDGAILYRGRDLGEIARLLRARLAELPAAK